MSSSHLKVLVLSACQALFMSGNTLVMASSALVGLALAPDVRLASVPLGIQFLATFLATYPASLFMSRVGRRPGLMCGALIGALGGALSALAIFWHSFASFCAACVALGVYSAFSQYYRFAAADVAQAQFKSRAISLVMAGGIVAAFVGPWLAGFTKDLVPGAGFALGYASIALLALSCLLLLALAGDISEATSGPGTGTVDEGPARPLWRIATSLKFMAAVSAGMLGYAMMNLLMTSTPLAMAVCGFDYGATTTVIQWHILGMFAPSFVTGSLIRRFGATTIVSVGILCMALCVVANLLGTGLANFWSALFLLGVGWNFMFIGATSLVTEVYKPTEKAKVQGLNDALVFGMVGVTASGSGWMHAVLGWATMNALVFVPIAVAALFMLALIVRERQSGPARLAAA